MADVTQSGSVDATININTNVTGFPVFPYSNTVDNNFLTGGIIHDGYLYITIYEDDSPDTNNKVTYVYRLDITTPETSNWELVNAGPWAYANTRNAGIGICDGKFYALGVCYSNNSKGWTMRYNPAINTWDTTPILEFGDDGNYTSYDTHIDSSIVTQGNSYIYHLAAAYYWTRCLWKLYKWNLSNLLATPSTTSTMPMARQGGSGIFYNGKLYILGGFSSSDTGGSVSTTNMPAVAYGDSGSYTNLVIAYTENTDTWETSPIPNIPAPFYRKWNCTLAGSVIYLICPAASLCHYYDLEWGSTGTWQSFNYPIVQSGDWSITWDNLNNYIWAIAPNGIVYKLELDSNQYPKTGYWYTPNFGVQNPVQIGVSDSTITISSNNYDAHSTSTSDVSFTIASSSTQITSFSVTYLNPTLFEILSTPGIVMVGIAASATSVSFELGSYSNDTVLGAETVIIEDLLSDAEGWAYWNVDQLGVANSAILFETDGGAVIGVIGSGTSNFLIQSTGYGLFNLFQNAVIDCDFDITSDAEGVSNSLSSFVNTIAFELNMFASGNLVVQGEVVYPEPTVDAWCVNMTTGGHSRYTNFMFNGFFKLNGVMYGTSERGLVRLGGITDNGDVIEAYAATGVTDFGVSKKKNISSSYAHIRTDGEVTLQLNADEQINRRGYKMVNDGREGLHRRRIKSAKGIKATNWQLEIGNVNGSDVELNTVETDVVIMGRTV